jgi:hypothetical protein
MMTARNMKRPRINQVLTAAAAVVMVCAFSAGCKKNVREQVREERRGPLVVTWEFKSVDRGEDPYTEASLIINGSQMHKHMVGVFYGRVRGIFKPEEINKQMIGGTISGFTTSYRGRGHEVIVRYNEEAQRLIVAERQWNEKLPTGSFGPIKNIPVPELKKEQTGF